MKKLERVAVRVGNAWSFVFRPPTLFYSNDAAHCQNLRLLRL
jgi:hypothetical protein